MPYTIAENDKGEYCVYKKAPDDGPEGETLGCHPTKDQAVAQIGAIESSEAGRARMTMGTRENGIERRDMQTIELRVDDVLPPVVEGYAAVFNSLSDTLFEVDTGRFREKVAPGAFARTIKNQNIPLLIEHADLPLATTKAGTLKLWEDAHGLRFSSMLEPSDPDVQRLVPKMRRGDMARCSFGFVPVKETWDERERPRVRTLHEVKLFDVSIVARPAYPATEATVRKLLMADGLDIEDLADALVRLQQGTLDDDDKVLLRRLVNICQPHISETATAPAADPLPLEHSANGRHPASETTNGPDVIVHPLSWYKARLENLGV